jgi:hypothetical protein
LISENGVTSADMERLPLVSEDGVIWNRHTDGYIDELMKIHYG